MKRLIILGLIVLFSVSILIAVPKTVDELYTELIITGATHDVAIEVIDSSEIDDHGNVLAIADGWYEGADGTFFLIKDGRCVAVAR